MVEILEENGQLIVRIGQHEYARYHFDATLMKPYLYPLRAANGLSLLADSPTDHRHHHGIWVGHGRVEEGDFWQERHNSGKIVHREFVEVVSGESSAHFIERCDWLDPSEGLLLQDERTFRFYNMPVEARHFDFELLLKAPEGRVTTLHPTNEAGLPHVRVAMSLTPRGGGAMTNAEGKKNERQTYRQRSAWIDCSGVLGRITCGLAMFNHPENPEHPTPWFTRDYGPFSPNYGFFLSEPLEITAQNPLHLRYRFYSHSGDVEVGQVQAKWEEYLHEVTTSL